jgi:hypothetical protein
MKNVFRLLFKHKIFLATMLITALLGTSCNIPRAQSGPTQVPQLVFPTFPPTVTPEILTATAGAAEAATNVPSSTALPTVIKAPTTTPGTAPQPQTGPASTSVSGGTRLVFARGSTAEVIQGAIQSGQTKNFIVGAMQGQPLIVSVDSNNHDVTFSVVGQKDRRTLLDVAQNMSSWQTILTTTQDYLITLYPGADAENFTLNIIIPARIAFQSGASSVTVQGSTPDGLIVSYVLHASAGQQMDINLNSPDGNAVLGVYGYQDGQPYLRSASESTTFSMKLPTTEDYIIQVALRAGMVANYTMKVTVK